MAAPKYHEIMLPLLQFSCDKNEHSMREAYEALADEFNLSEQDRKELLPSGQQYVFVNRVGWARTYLKKALLLESRSRGHFQITDRGLDVLKDKPKVINKEYLLRFTEFQEFKTRTKANKAETKSHDDEKTPKDLIEENYHQMTESVSEDLLEQIRGASDSFFEKLVVDLLLKMGYGGSRKDAGQAIGKSGDQGIDGIINEDKLGLDVIYIQAKKWTSNKVGGSDIRNFLGSLELKHAQKGVFITTSWFTKDAIESARQSSRKVILIDGIRLTDLMIEYDLGVSTEASYLLKKIDSDYFEDV